MEAGRRGSFTVRAFLNACSWSWRLRASSGGRGRGSLSLMEGEATEMFGGLRITLVASKKAKGIKTGRCLCIESIGLGMSMSTHRSESMFNKYEFEYTVKTSFTLKRTLRKSGVEGGWDLASPYVVHSCLHTQWSHILGLVGGGDKDLSQGVNKPVRVGVKTGFTLEVTPRKSGVEGGWDLASPYVVLPCLHAQWSRILGLVGGGDKDLS